MKTDGKAALNKLRKRTSLMEAAFALFTEEGFQNTTIADIAKRAGIGKGTFYFYFEDKYDIRNRIIITKSYEILHEALNSLPDQNDTFENKVIYVADRIIEKLAADRILLRFIHKNLSWAILENSAEMSETFNNILKQAQQTAFTAMPSTHPTTRTAGTTWFMTTAHRSSQTTTREQPSDPMQARPAWK